MRRESTNAWAAIHLCSGSSNHTHLFLSAHRLLMVPILSLCSSSSKFNSGCGWPAFFEALPNAVNTHEDKSFGMSRTEITCSKCGGHLGTLLLQQCVDLVYLSNAHMWFTYASSGHVFKGEGFSTPTDERHCVNSVSLKFDSNHNRDAGSNM